MRRFKLVILTALVVFGALSVPAQATHNWNPGWLDDGMYMCVNYSAANTFIYDNGAGDLNPAKHSITINQTIGAFQVSGDYVEDCNGGWGTAGPYINATNFTVTNVTDYDSSIIITFISSWFFVTGELALYGSSAHLDGDFRTDPGSTYCENSALLQGGWGSFPTTPLTYIPVAWEQANPPARYPFNLDDSFNPISGAAYYFPQHLWSTLGITLSPGDSFVLPTSAGFASPELKPSFAGNQWGKTDTLTVSTHWSLADGPAWQAGPTEEIPLPNSAEMPCYTGSSSKIEGEVVFNDGTGDDAGWGVEGQDQQGTIEFDLDNCMNHDYPKRVWMDFYVKTTGEATWDATLETCGDEDVTLISTDKVGDLPDGWEIYRMEWWIWPQPACERITFDLTSTEEGDAVWLRDVYIWTHCPEPGTIMLLAFGMGAALARRRRA